MSNADSIEAHLKFEKGQRERRFFLLIHSSQHLEAFEVFRSSVLAGISISQPTQPFKFEVYLSI